MVEDVILFEHLHKLVVLKSENEIENLLQLLWLTRKTGLSASQKSSIQSLLNLPSPDDLDPVLVSIRSLMRNCVHKDLEGDDGLKLLPPGLPLELDSRLCILLQKHQSHWKEEEQVNLGISAPLLPSPSWVVSESLLSLQVHPIPHFNDQNHGGQTPITVERNAVCFLPQSILQNDVVPQEIPGVLPRVKSMTWTVENRSEMPNHRVAIITLKLQDYTRSPSNEMEVKFQLSRVTLEAVLRSMAYINRQLSQLLRGYFGRLGLLHYHYRRNKDYDWFSARIPLLNPTPD